MPDRLLSVRLQQLAPIPLDVEFTCGPGEVLAIFGPSGSGKTTILRAIAGLYAPAHGSVRSGETVWSDAASGTIVPPHRRAVGYVFQDYALFPHLTAEGNVIAALGHLPRENRRSRATALLAQVGLSDRAAHRPAELSGGERQRVALARAMARDPDVLLLDEPFAAVDRTVRRRLQEGVEALRRTLDVPMILVTHDFDDVIRLATHVLLLEQGKSVAYGPIATMMSRPDLAWLRDAAGLGAVLEATVVRFGADTPMVELQFDGGSLLVPERGLPDGALVRIRIPAREVILATRPPEGVSLHNVLAGEVTDIHCEKGLDRATVQVAVGRTLLLAEITEDAVGRLRLSRGTPVHALIKSVSIDVLSIRTPGAEAAAR